MKRGEIVDFTTGGQQFPAIVISVDEIENTAHAFVFSVRQNAYPVANARITEEFEENCVTSKRKVAPYVGPAGKIAAEREAQRNALAEQS